MSIWKIQIICKQKYNKHVQNLQMFHSPFAVPLCFFLATVKPCFVSERITRTDPRTVFSNKILNFWATIVIQNFYILFEKFGQQSTRFESFGKHVYIQYLHVVKNS